MKATVSAAAARGRQARDQDGDVQRGREDGTAGQDRAGDARPERATDLAEHVDRRAGHPALLVRHADHLGRGARREQQVRADAGRSEQDRDLRVRGRRLLADHEQHRGRRQHEAAGDRDLEADAPHDAGGDRADDDVADHQRQQVQA
jgi:hypothetical protein